MKLILKHRLYPVALGVIVLGLAIWLMNQFEISVQWESGVPPLQSSPKDGSSGAIAPSTNPPSSPSSGSAGVVAGTDSQPSRSPSPAIPTASPSVLPSVSTPQTSAQNALQLGGLRISNQTDYPIRVVLLSQITTQPTPTPAGKDTAAEYDEPIHWDFAPQEGNIQGLLLALPDRDLLLQAGDVLVAFAQDGSRRYWGPYVVGTSVIPQWNLQTKEWQLRVQMP